MIFDHSLGLCGSIGVVWIFMECQFQDFGSIWCMWWDGLNFGSSWGLEIFFVWSNQLKRGMEPFCMLLVRGIFSLTKSPFFFCLVFFILLCGGLFYFFFF